MRCAASSPIWSGVRSPWPDRPDDRGSATAEFAVVVPAVVLVIALTVGAVSIAGRQVRLEQAAAQAARLAARGESSERMDAVVAAIAEGRVSGIWDDGELVCVSATAATVATWGPVPMPELVARSCALAGGR